MQKRPDPLSKLLDPNTINKILEHREEQKRIEAVLAEEVEEYKKVVNRIFSSRDGQYLLKKMIRFSGLFSFDNKFDASMIDQKGKQKMITELLLPYLDKTLLAKAISE